MNERFSIVLAATITAAVLAVVIVAGAALWKSPDSPMLVEDVASLS
jgi:hypothetical protein